MNYCLMLFSLLSFSCTQSVPDERQNVRSKTTPSQGADGSTAKGPVLELSWNPVGGSVDAYHIFYVEEPVNEGGVEITSLMNSSPDFKQPRIKVDTQLVQLKGGKSACFYIIADAAGTMSEASDAVCVDL